MERRRFLTRAGLLTAGGVAGVAAGLGAEHLLTQEGPTARTARPLASDMKIAARRIVVSRQIASQIRS